MTTILKSVVQQLKPSGPSGINILAKRLLSPFVSLSLVVTLSLSSFATAQSSGSAYADEWGPQIGSTLPILAAQDHSGKEQTLMSLAGEQG